MLSPEVFRDNRVLASNDRFTVLRAFDPVDLPNDPGTTNIHTVQHKGQDLMFHRAIVTHEGVVVFNITDVVPSLQDIVNTHPHDVPGLIKYTLRFIYRDKTHADLQEDMVFASRRSDTLPLDAEAAHAPEVQAA